MTIKNYFFRETADNDCPVGLALLATLFIASCGAELPESSADEQPSSVSAPESTPQQPPTPGFGPIIIRALGTTPKPDFGTVYVGECDDRQPDDDMEVMTFSAPWKTAGAGSAGKGARYGTPIMRSFEFEKDPDLTTVRLSLDSGREKSDLTAADLTDGLPKVADIAFGSRTVGLHRVPETYNLKAGYAAIFPLIEVEGLPTEPGLTSRYIATVQLISLAIPEFEGWSEAEIIQLFESFYASRCLAKGLEQGWAVMAPTVIFE